MGCFPFQSVVVGSGDVSTFLDYGVEQLDGNLDITNCFKLIPEREVEFRGDILEPCD